jgi:hypothetical protein
MRRASIVRADGAMPCEVGVRRAPAQVDVEHVADEVVREQAVRAALHEGSLAQPREQLAGVVAAEHRLEEVLRGGPRVRGDLEGLPVAGGGHVVGEPLDERADRVGCLGERRLRPLGEHVDQQRQGERVAVREDEGALVQRFRDAFLPQIGARVVGGQVAQGDDAQQLLPAGA